MNKVAVIYAGKYGTTKQYANWISEEVQGDVFEAVKCKASDLEDYDTIVFGGAIHAGKILSIEFLQKNIKNFSNKKVLAFAVGLNVEGEEIRKQCMEFNFAKKLPDVPCYFLPGAYDPRKIAGMDKVIMGTMKKFMKKMLADNSTDEQRKTENELLYAIEHGADYTDRQRIAPIVDAVRK